MRVYDQLRIDRSVRPRDTGGVLPTAVVVTLIAVSMYVSELTPSKLSSSEGWQAARDFALGLFPPALSPALLKLAGRAAVETLAISIAGTFLAILLDGMLAPFASRVWLIRGILSLF